ncbi:hypothetical protein K439DRAFT_1642591, partial [Ramaria rubella]
MPVLKKKKLQVKQQRASNGFRFNSGLTDNLLELKESNSDVDVLPCESEEEDVDKSGLP